ncbi:hypothetical protein CEUSTIGMA_g7914.t1 [Chlamydomonas eustigma]|uniref:Uncharacterized protein n=1 Tax=Chlamydomonas eustigma TaxID=1157962 RepID=A0A250XBL8_9CHLO|nr:hypothetical protein CEUSTIGMA_g7914.t1 [Chlamydomonas eustigma]|eukprot:GAX80475.1 hypothetical protein CEUSTIGMA_g7914.t1 [Chlamydomonas eustigma]
MPEHDAEADVKEVLIEEDEHVHYSQRSPWLRAFVLGALDGLVSVACTILGVSGGNSSLALMRLAGISAWIACAMAMAAGEYISVSSQKDCEEADIQKEREIQAQGPEARAHELEELACIYENRGLDPILARKVAEELTAHDVILAHARDELGIDMDDMSDPYQAALVSAIACTLGAAIPLLAGAFVTDDNTRIGAVVGATAAGCALFGVTASALGGAGIVKGCLRVLIGGSLSMGITYGIGRAFGTTIN